MSQGQPDCREFQWRSARSEHSGRCHVSWGAHQHNDHDWNSFFGLISVNYDLPVTTECPPSLSWCVCQILLFDLRRTRKEKADYMRAYNKRNPERTKAIRRREFWRNREKYRAKAKIYYRKNRAACIERGRLLCSKRHRTDICYRIRKRIQRSILFAIRGQKSGRKSQDFLGCTIPQFKAYIESLWKPGMSWKNYGVHGWHLDHIVPESSFDMQNDEEVKKCFHHRNYQPLWADENIRKWKHIHPRFGNVEAARAIGKAQMAAT